MVYTETGTYNKAPKYKCDMTNYYAKACRQVVSNIEKEKEGEYVEEFI